MKKFQIPGKTKAQKLKNLDVVLGRMAKRMNRKTIVAVPPVIISQTVAEAHEDVVFAALVPVLGKFSKLCLMCEQSVEGQGFGVEVSISTPISSESLHFNTNTFYMVQDVNKQLVDFSLIKVFIRPSESVARIFTSISIYPDKGSLERDFFLEPKDNFQLLLEGLSDG